jgi:lia operon protein LiaG
MSIPFVDVRRWPGRLALAAAILFGLHSAAAQPTERHAVPGGSVAVYNLAGRVRVEGGSGADVVVEVTRGGADAGRLRIESGPRRDWQTLRVVYPADRVVYPRLGDSGSRTDLRVDEHGFFGDSDESGRGFRFGGDRVQIRGSGAGLEAWADLRVVVPRGKRVAVYLAAGEALVSNVDGDLSIDVHAASITTEHTRGKLNLDTGSGSVRVSDAEGNVNLDTGSGSVTVSNIRGDELRMDTGSGSISGSGIEVRLLDADVGSGGVRLTGVRTSRISLDTGSGTTDVEVLTDVDDVNVDAGSGGVSLRLPANAGAEVEIETGSGGVETDFPIQVSRMERNYLRGRLGDGRGRIKIDSGSGRVRLLKI